MQQLEESLRAGSDQIGCLLPSGQAFYDRLGVIGRAGIPLVGTVDA
jgi:hypothetical protein